MPVDLATLFAAIPGPIPTAGDLAARLLTVDPHLEIEWDDEAPRPVVRSSDLKNPWTVVVADLNLLIAELGGSRQQHSGLTAADYAIGVNLPATHGDPITTFEQLVRILRTIAPGASAVVDVVAGVVHPAAWLHQVVLDGVPVPLDELYRVHLHKRGPNLWLHTRGLRRFGLQEIELPGLNSGEEGIASRLLQLAAHRALTRGPLTVGASLPIGENLRCTVVPWRYARDDLSRQGMAPGRRPPALTDDDLVLASWKPTSSTTGAWESILPQLRQLGDEPVLYLSDYETDRMEALARLRWTSFAALVSDLQSASGWRFLAKFSVTAPQRTTREHLWFEVHSANPTGADATLVSEPTQPNGLSAGDRRHMSLQQLTDFRVTGPLGVASPDNITQLLAALRNHTSIEA